MRLLWLVVAVAVGTFALIFIHEIPRPVMFILGAVYMMALMRLFDRD